MIPKTYSLRAAAELIDVSRRTLANWLRQAGYKLNVRRGAKLYLTEDILERVLDAHILQRPQSISELTPRELQLTSLLVQGLANKEIAARLNLSLQTVKNHVHNILQKTQSKNRAILAQISRGGV